MSIQSKMTTFKLSSSHAVTSIIQHPKQEDRVVAIGGQGQLFVLGINPLKLRKVIKVTKQYAMCLLPYEDGFLIGGSLGELVHMNWSYEIIYFQKLHSDCVSSIIENDHFIVTTSYDGKVFFLNKKTFQLEKSVELEGPIWSAYCYENKIFAAGNPSYCITPHTNFSVKQIKRFDLFQAFERRLYGCSDERGLTCLSMNSNSYIPCNYILPLERSFLTFSEQCVGVVRHHHAQMEWKCQRVKQIKKGTTIKSGLRMDKTVIVGDDAGKIYKFYYQEPKQ